MANVFYMDFMRSMLEIDFAHDWHLQSERISFGMNPSCSWITSDINIPPYNHQSIVLSRYILVMHSKLSRY